MVLRCCPESNKQGIVIFNEKNQYLGDYYLTMTYDIPDKIEGKYLVFIMTRIVTALQAWSQE
jgi:hypothetical protein